MISPKFDSLSALMDADENGQLDDSEFDDELWLSLTERIESPADRIRCEEPVFVYYASRYLEWEVGNGGFAQAAYNIPEWFAPAAWAYDKLGLPKAAALIREAIPIAEDEKKSTTFAATEIGALFEQFAKSKLAELDESLDDVEWWAHDHRLRYVRTNRDAFRRMAKPAR